MGIVFDEVLAKVEPTPPESIPQSEQSAPPTPTIGQFKLRQLLLQRERQRSRLRAD